MLFGKSTKFKVVSAKYYFFIMAVILTAFLFSTRVILAECSQRPDLIKVYQNGSLISDFGVILASQDQEGAYKIESVCIKGKCFLEADQLAGKALYFFEVDDPEIITAYQTQLPGLEDELKEENEGVGPSGQIYLLHLAYTGNGQFTAQILNKINDFKRYDYNQPENLPNNFTIENCDYQRQISYDLKKQKVIGFSDGKLASFIKYGIKPGRVLLGVAFLALLFLATYYPLKKKPITFLTRLIKKDKTPHK